MVTHVAASALSRLPPEGAAATETPVPGAVASAEFERLRELLLGDERRALDAAHARIDAITSTQNDLASRLPDALDRLRGGNQAGRIANALAEPVRLALGNEVKKNPHSLVDALFPIIGPLIRKSIAEALRALVADLNAAIESSFSVRGIRWRIEAWRAGVPYAQVVLKHRCSYAIDHVFLIAADSGLVLHHEAAAGLPELDGDAIAGMLTALRDFIGDSVGARSTDALDSVRVGEYLVWVVPGPRAYVACFMRGVPPETLRELLAQCLEDFHAQLAESDAEDADHNGALVQRHAMLQPAALLDATRVDTGSLRTRPARWPIWLLVALIMLAIAASALSRERWHARIDALRSALGDHAGFVLTGIDARPWREVTVRGLLDPDAAPVEGVLAAAHLGAAKTRVEIVAYVSGDDAIIARRAERLLVPPAGVHLEVDHALLTARGEAPAAWIEHARERAPWIAGVAKVDFQVTPETDFAAAARAQLVDALDALARRHVAFAEDTSPAADAPAALDAIAAAVQHAQQLARIGGIELAIQSVGTTDEVGSAAKNAQLRSERARWLALALTARGIADIEVAPASDASEADMRGAFIHASAKPSAR